MNELAAQIAAAFVGLLGASGFLRWAILQWREERKIDRDQRAGERADERSDRREDRAEIAGVSRGVVDLQLTLASMLERDRIRDERRKRESMTPLARGRASVPVGEDWEDQDSNVVTIKDRMRERIESSRKQTPPAGVRPPRGGTHHDEGR